MNGGRGGITKRLKLETPCAYLNKCLVVLLHPGGGHAVDDRVPAGIHGSNGVADGQKRQTKDDHEPQDDVEDDRVILVVVGGQIEFIGGAGINNLTLNARVGILVCGLHKEHGVAGLLGGSQQATNGSRQQFVGLIQSNGLLAMSLGNAIDGQTDNQNIRWLQHLSQVLRGRVDKSDLLKELLVGVMQGRVQVLGGLGSRRIGGTEAGLECLHLQEVT